MISPSVDVDAPWLPVKRKRKNVQHTDEDPIYLDHYDTEALHEKLDTQHKKLNIQKKKLFSNIDNY